MPSPLPVNPEATPAPGRVWRRYFRLEKLVCDDPTSLEAEMEVVPKPPKFLASAVVQFIFSPALSLAKNVPYQIVLVENGIPRAKQRLTLVNRDVQLRALSMLIARVHAKPCRAYIAICVRDGVVINDQHSTAVMLGRSR